ncbi:MAG: hypothetical protein GWN84_00250 [Gammaproteobacteria bacterium]|nr:hypothetical protein [Gammaproteobacteria bacterium]NIR81636.1 hypothetical protein [Gammaproteobacteria bacterium]NIR88187.1 hypothetical protein [Gammaproteobacteria bacterium]NIU02748.1 hypothetical protein [Gammaproteobacteria bacterium]NIV73347.1 hypothetical protein [Gammaproteobacteria bacterium]
MRKRADDSKVSKLRPKHTRYEYRIGWRRMVLEFDERYLHERWEERSGFGSRTYLLHYLSPRFAQVREMDPDAVRNARIGGALLLAAIVVFFSAYNANIPLLAPVLLLLSLGPLVQGLRHIRPRTWTYIYDDDGNYVTAILVDDTEPEEAMMRREGFEGALGEHIERAKQKEYYEE